MAINAQQKSTAASNDFSKNKTSKIDERVGARRKGTKLAKILLVKIYTQCCEGSTHTSKYRCFVFVLLRVISLIFIQGYISLASH